MSNSMSKNTGKIIGNVFKNFLGSVKEDFLTFPLFVISHPFKGFDEMKFQKRGKLRFVWVMALLQCAAIILSATSMGFVVSGYYLETPVINLPYLLLMSLAPIALFVIGNWSVTTVTNGKGKMTEILMIYAYALYPKIFLHFIGLIVSHIVVSNEAAFALFFFTFGEICFYFFLFIGLISIHEYSFFKAVFTALLTIGAMAVIIFVLALFTSLVGEVLEFIRIVSLEIAIKL